MQNHKYRPEIDGLRAIAVLPVMLFHAGFTSFSGGFVGVDIFFVLSGYLITSIIIDEIEKGKFSLWGFYERRARRILPALILVVLATLPPAYFWMTATQWNAFAESLVGVAGFASNIIFWLQTDYFSTASELKPLLHTWSLAVEEQFYIIFPLLMLLVMRLNRQTLLPVFVIIGLVSLGWSEYAAYQYDSANFFLLPSRAWELLAGAVCALWLRGSPMGDMTSSAEQPSDSTWHILSLPEPLQHVAAISGLVMIIIAIAVFDQSTPFPSLYALLPVIGTMALILFLRPGFWLTHMLSIKPLVAIGLISYGAYLWHQPILAFYRMKTFVHQPVILIGLLVLSLFMAMISYWLVERPIRYSFLKNRSHKMFLALSALALIVIAATGLGARFAPLKLPHEQSISAAPYGGDGYGWQETFKGDTNSSPPVILYGDSVARQYIEGLRKTDKGRKRALELITAPSCISLPLAYRSQNGTIAPECLRNIDLLYKRTVAQPDSVIVMAQDWHGRLVNKKAQPIGSGGIPQDPQAIEALIFNLDAVASQLPEATRLVLVGQQPSTQDAGMMMSGGPSRCAQFIDIYCPQHIERNLVLANRINMRLAAVAQRFENVIFVNPMDTLCDEARCYFERDGQSLYFDNSHLSPVAAQGVARQITAAIQSSTAR